MYEVGGCLVTLVVTSCPTYINVCWLHCVVVHFQMLLPDDGVRSPKYVRGKTIFLTNTLYCKLLVLIIRSILYSRK